SKWVWISTNPGVTTFPVASIVVGASPASSAMAVIRPLAIPMSARWRGAPVPSTTSPPRMMTSNIAILLAEGVQGPAVIPEKLLFQSIVEWQLQQALDGKRPFGVGVREIGREDDVVIQAERLQALGAVFVGFDRDVALTAEILGRLHLELRAFDMTAEFVVFI